MNWKKDNEFTSGSCITGPTFSAAAPPPPPEGREGLGQRWYDNVTKKEIAKRNLGQDIPILLNYNIVI